MMDKTDLPRCKKLINFVTACNAKLYEIPRCKNTMQIKNEISAFTLHLHLPLHVLQCIYVKVMLSLCVLIRLFETSLKCCHINRRI